MTIEKNHSFAIRVFKELLQKMENAHLVLIGDGPLRKELESLAEDLNVSDSVSFLGNRNDLHRLLQGMDSFIMPSLYEGFGIAALEAAASGLPIYLSDTIPNVFNFYSKCHFLSLKDYQRVWAEQILLFSESKRSFSYKEVVNAGYDLKSTIAIFESIYRKEFKR